MSDPAHLIRYRLPEGNRFTIGASTAERITIDSREIMDVDVSFSLACEVAEASGEQVVIDGRFHSPKISGRALSGLLPDVAGLSGCRIRVRKGLDGRVHDVLDAEPVERLFGGLTAANALNWFAAMFAPRSVGVGDRWESRDRWVLRADRTPLGVDLPLRPEVDVRYGYRLRRVRTGEGTACAEIDVDVGLEGGAVSSDLGLELTADGAGRGEVVVDLDAGKLARSRKEAVLRLVPRPTRRGALALPPLRVQRRSEAGFRDWDG